MLVPTVVLFVSVSLRAAVQSEIIGAPLLNLILHCSQPWSEDKKGVCPEACRRWPQYCYYAIAAQNKVPGTCVLPPYPLIGSYSIVDIKPAGALADFTLLYICPPDYSLNGQHPRCTGGSWTTKFPSCLKDLKCTLPSVPSVHFTCGSSAECPKHVGSGQRVLPECRTGFAKDELRPMHCIDGSWSYVATCRAECGILLSNGHALKREADSIETPWYAGVYLKTLTPYKQICGGTLISVKVVISAAHCFWSETDQRTSPAHHYAVAVGITVKPWKYYGGQKSNVSDIKIPPHFRGSANHFQSDIALVTLNKSVGYNAHVLPACLDFSNTFDQRQLQPGNIGKVAGWSLTPSLKVISLSYVDVDQCFTDLPMDFHSYISSDKICAKTIDTALCKGDSGGGLVLPRLERSPRWYLRGVASTAPAPEPPQPCPQTSYTAFTHVIRHEAFLTKHLNGRRDYINEIYIIP